MRLIVKNTKTVFIFVILMILAGCAGTTQPSRFYMLNTLPESESLASAKHTDALSLGIGPVKLPGYLDRPQIVTRTTANQVQIAEFERWAEPLTGNFTRVLAENLSTLLATDQIAFDPWQRSMQIDYQIIVEVLRFDRSANGKVMLRALWALARNDGREILTIRKSNIEVPVADTEAYAPVVSAQSQAIGSLSREIAQTILKLE